MKLFGREADYTASWGFSSKLSGLSRDNFSREGTSSFNTGFILDSHVITEKFTQYAKAAAEVTEELSGEVEYFEPESDENLTAIANEMDEKVNIRHVLNGNWDKRDRLADEILEAISEKHGRKKVNTAEELAELVSTRKVLGANLVFEKDGEAANLKFDSSKISSYQAENSGRNKQKPFELKVYGNEDFRKNLNKSHQDFAGRWSDWDLARNKTREKLQDLGLY